MQATQGSPYAPAPSEVVYDARARRWTIAPPRRPRRPVWRHRARKPWGYHALPWIMIAVAVAILGWIVWGWAQP